MFLSKGSHGPPLGLHDGTRDPRPARLPLKNSGCQAARRLACLAPCADMMLPASNFRSSPPSRLGSAGRTLLPCEASPGHFVGHRSK